MKHILSLWWAKPERAAQQVFRNIGIDHSRVIEAHYLYTQRLISICLTCVLIMLIWSSFASVPQSAHGTAKVVPSRKLQIVQAVDGGVITDLKVSEGEHVEKGQVLLQIDTTRFNSSLNEKKAVEGALLLKEARLRALLENNAYKPPGYLKNTYPEIYKQEQKLLETVIQEWKAQLAVLEDQVNQREREKDEADSRTVAAKRSLELLQKELTQIRPLITTGAISPVEVLRLEKQIASTNGDYEAAQAQSQRLKSAIREARGKIREESYKLTNRARTELTEVTAKLASLRQNKLELSDRVEQATLRSPVSGKVQRILFNTPGAVVPAGREIVEIVPSDDQLVFDTRIQPKDIGFIRPEQTATIRISAYDYSIYGSLRGYVESISADSLIDDYGNPYYDVKIIAPIEAVPENVRLLPGMTADISILTEDRTVLSYLIKPLSRGISRAFTER